MIASLSLFRDYLYRAVITQHHDPIQRVLGTAVATMLLAVGVGIGVAGMMEPLIGFAWPKIVGVSVFIPHAGWNLHGQ